MISFAVAISALEVVLRLLTQDRELLGTKLVGSELIDRQRIGDRIPRLMAIYDRELGWTSLPEDGKTGPRGDPGYAPDPPGGVMRVCAFGESFTRGDGVTAAESWPSQAETQTGGRIQILNFGVGAYGLDQSFLRFRRFAPLFHPHVILLGLTQHAIERTTNLYRPFYSHDTGIALAKPRFALEGDTLRQVLVDIPHPAVFVEEIADFDHHPLRRYESYYDPAIFESSWMDGSRILWFARSRLAWRRRLERFETERIMSASSEEMVLARALVQQMAGEARAMGVRFGVVILPTHRMLRLLKHGDDLWAPFREQLDAAGIGLCDVQAVFAAEPDIEQYYLHDGHLNATGNARVAAAVVAFLGRGQPTGLKRSNEEVAELLETVDEMIGAGGGEPLRIAESIGHRAGAQPGTPAGIDIGYSVAHHHCLRWGNDEAIEGEEDRGRVRLESGR
jgi:hypothetical protein